MVVGVEAKAHTLSIIYFRSDHFKMREATKYLRETRTDKRMPIVRVEVA